jgi:hypothetical protein
MHAAWGFIISSAIWFNPILSGLIAAFSVHLLTQSREREKWILDCKRQEFRELLSALSDAYSKTLFMLRPLKALDGDEETQLRQAQSNSVRVIRDRIYIAKDIKPNEMSNRWLRAMERYEALLNPQSLHEEYEAIRNTIVVAANRSVPKSSFQKLQFWKERL